MGQGEEDSCVRARQATCPCLATYGMAGKAEGEENRILATKRGVFRVWHGYCECCKLKFVYPVIKVKVSHGKLEVWSSQELGTSAVSQSVVVVGSRNSEKIRRQRD